MSETPAESPKKSAPYVAYTSFKSFLNGLREGGGAPIVIDNSVYGNISGSLRSQLKGALKFFDLIDNSNRPTDRMPLAIMATGDAGMWKIFVGELLRDFYAPILAHPLTNTTTAQLQKEFQANYGGSGDVVEKAITFFIFAAKEAGIALSPRLTERQKPVRRSGGGGSRRQREMGEAPGAGTPDVVPPAPATKRKVSEHQMTLVEIINTYTDMDAEMRAALLNVVGFIATKGVGT